MQLSDEETKAFICRAPEYYAASHEWANKKVALFAMPGKLAPKKSKSGASYLQRM